VAANPVCYDGGMPTVTISLRRTKSEEEQACGVCGAWFMPLEDSGSRVLSVKAGDQDAITALMCGGCHSKWSGGMTVTLKAAPLPPATA
jgi:hypothetical protein